MAVDEIDIPPRGIERQGIAVCGLVCPIIGETSFTDSETDRPERHQKCYSGGAECDPCVAYQPTSRVLALRRLAGQLFLRFAFGFLVKNCGLGAFGALALGLNSCLGLCLFAPRLAPLTDTAGQ